VEDFFDLNKLKAKVYLMKDGDTSNMAMVTDEKLMFVRNGKKMRFSLPEVKGLSSGNKKQLFPLIIGRYCGPICLFVLLHKHVPSLLSSCVYPDGFIVILHWRSGQSSACGVDVKR
jgi:hypothetical protein